MNGTNYVDKVYLALELTKLSCSNRSIIIDKDIYKTFTYFLCKLMSVDNFAVIDEYKKKIESLEEELTKVRKCYNELKLSSNSNVKSNVISIKKYINDNGSNMEPDIKIQLLKLLDSIFD